MMKYIALLIFFVQTFAQNVAFKVTPLEGKLNKKIIKKMGATSMSPYDRDSAIRMEMIKQADLSDFFNKLDFVKKDVFIKHVKEVEMTYLSKFYPNVQKSKLEKLKGLMEGKDD